MKFSRLFASSLLIPFALNPLSLAVAQESQDSPTNLIVVTGTYGPKTVGESLSSVTVLDEEEIRTKAPAEFSDLLRSQPGINVTGNGSFGKSTSVNIRGVKNAGTVFLLDGVKVHSATAGGAPWQFIPTELVQRVEVVRGPRSSLYGADAMGGVVQAFTLDPKYGQRGWVEAGAGNFNTQKVSAGVSGSTGNTRYSLSGLHKDTDGTAVIENGDDQGFRNTAGLGRVVHDFDNGGEASILVLQSEGNTEYEGGNTDFTVRTIGLGMTVPLNAYWQTGIQFSESRDESDSFEDWGDSTHNTRLRQARWENTFSYSGHDLIVGTELQQDEVSSTEQYSETSRTNTAAFSQLRLSFGPADAHLSLRTDDNEAYGTKETGGVALGYSIDGSHRVRASYGTAFRAPTFNDLYWPLAFNYQGNPNLKPEESENYELGASGNYNRWFWDLAVYQMDIENLIGSGQIGGVDTRVNVNEARIRGTELSGGYASGGWRTAIALAYMNPEDRETGNQLRRLTRQTARVDLDKAFGGFTLGGSVIAEGHRYDDAANNDRLPGFATIDLRAGWYFAPNWSSRLTVANVLDKEYSTAKVWDGRNYIAAGRNAMLSVRYDIH
ncbi:TonB-dependent receptor domain-containing protein [Marinobacter sp. X15-166B]|uniref:TonB-dependent receptor domain-containing protein n=1 Tax=Marinobacter sp. X15-166B TaxID=1897620 RepID=UPI00085CC3DE|nr:TonB-dependent receptor [Marinobacter sp. X15-166B]OEY66237.1 TonB-dependent receptor [Marinobacter sp. X15-166B]